MKEQKYYSPKFSKEEDDWQDSIWQTGSTQPPKNRGGVIALMLILIIFLCGIITLLGILNIKLFRKLQVQQENELSISFTVGQTEPTHAAAAYTEPTVPVTEETVFLDLQESRQGNENIPTEGAMSLQDIYLKNIDSVVSISSHQQNGSITGTGVIFSEEGYIVTNAHVVENAGSISVQLTDGRILPARIIGTDEITDIAVLFIDGESFIPAQFGNSDTMRVGDTVVAIGDPLGVEFRGTYTDGIVSAINRDVVLDGRTMTLIQTNAALNSGNSGGPLINCYGQVIGINTMKIGAFTSRAGVEGLGFAIPSATVKEVIDQLVSQGYVSGRPYIGLEGDALSTFYQYYYRMPEGMYITKVEFGSDAYNKGLEEGDILISLDGYHITTMDTLKTFLYSCDVGKVVKAQIYRNGQQYVLDLVIQEYRG